MLSIFRTVFLGVFLFTVGSSANAQVVIDFSSSYFKDVYDGRNLVLRKEIEVLNNLDNLSKIVEAKHSLTVSDIDKFADEVLSLTELSAKNVRDAIPVKSGLESVVSDTDIDAKRPFKGFYASSLSDVMLDILKDSGVYKPTGSDKAEFKKQNAIFDKRLEKITIEFTKLWIKDIRTGVEYDKVLTEYKKLINDIANFNMKFYESKLQVADSNKILKLKKVKEKKIDSEIKSRLKKIADNNKKIEKFK